ncbi:hypothetical protein CEXT_260491 [Caerostris extrusa]|uniref:Ycf15 n=1 Tax=Caerostris extrusa TaxID=172846 RepID=A0AAV4UFV2_CAEEX|nr:hypothetical protein CEXT_260491 [Caerostris extrusa]
MRFLIQCNRCVEAEWGGESRGNMDARTHSPDALIIFANSSESRKPLFCGVREKRRNRNKLLTHPGESCSFRQLVDLWGWRRKSTWLAFNKNTRRKESILVE